MIRRLLMLFLFLLIARSSFAQSTTVSGQVTDSNSQNWNNGTITAVFVVNPSYPSFPQYIWTGGTLNPQISGTLNATGAYSLSIPSNTAITPVNSQWRFQICTPASTPCFYTPPITITGATQTLNFTPPGILINLLTATPPVSAYADSELTGAKFGSRYYNLVSQTERVCQVISGNNCLTWVDVGAGSASAAGSPPQTQVNDPGNPGHFGGTPCENFPSLTIGPINADCDWHSKGPNPGFDITRYGARALVPPLQTTTATCTSGLSSVTLASAIDFINGDGITLTECGAATALSTPAAPSSVTPRGILNGASTVSYKIRAEDYSNGRTATSTATTITTANGTFGSIVRTISSASLASGIITVTTTANHNFQAGEKVQIKGTGTVMDAIWRVNTITNATVFTIQTQFVRSPQQNVTVATGTAESPSHIWVNWTAATNVLRYLIYRQDGGAGNYNLVGVAQGREPFYDDYGFGINATDLGPNVPTTDATGAQNQTLATTIVSGATTTNIVVANAASNSKTGSSALHDNTVAWIAATNAALAITGGEVIIPNAGSGQFYLTFPLQIPGGASGPINCRINGTVAAQQPFIPGSFQSFYGTTGNQGGKPSFQSSYYGGQLTGKGNPLIFLPGTSSVSFDHIFVAGDPNSKQQWLLLADNGASGVGGATSTQITNSYVNSVNAPNGSAAVVLRGIGFGQIFTNDVFANGGGGTITYLQQSALRITSSSLSTPNGSPGIGLVRDTSFVSGGIRLDGDSMNGASFVAGQNWIFNNVFTESLCSPVFDFQNVSTNAGGLWFITNVDAADPACGGQTPAVDLSGIAGTFTGLTVNNVGSVNAGTANVNAAAASIAGFTSTGNDNLPAGSVVTRGGSFNVGAGNPASKAPAGVQSLEIFGGAVRVVSPGKVFTEGDPPTGLSCTVQAGGTLPTGTQPITVTAADFDFGETVPSVSFPVTLSPGNQTINCSWTAPSPAPFGYYLYINGARANNGFLTTNSVVVSTVGGANFPLQSGGGPSGMSRASGMWTSQMAVVGTTGFSTKQTGTFTANRSVTWPDANGTIDVLGGLYNAYDNFNRANGSLGSNWSSSLGSGFTVSSNQAAANASDSIVFWNANTFTSDQFAELTVVSLGGGLTGPAVGMNATTGYVCYETSTAINIVKFSGGGFTPLTNTASGGSVGDILRCQRVGTTITAFRNGTQLLSTSDNSFSGGSPGMYGDTVTIDNWSGGNIHPIAQLDAEQDWTQPQHFTQPVTIGVTNPIAGTLAANTLYVPYVATDGGTPTCSVTGAGTGATCGTFQPQADDESGQFLISTGTTPAATGTITLTFNITSTRLSYCIFVPSNTGGANWNARATFFPTTSGGGSNNQAAWDNNAVSLTASTTYGVTYICGRH